MSDRLKKPPIAVGDLVTGAVIICVGLLATIEALGFDAASSRFPMFMSGLLITAGLALVILTLVKQSDTADTSSATSHDVRTPALACLVITAWTIAMTVGAGYVIPTFLMQVLLLRIAGVQRRIVIVGIAALITAVSYFLFVTVLDVALPASSFTAVLQGR